MKFKIKVQECFTIPHNYGVAYRNLMEGYSVCYLIPFNFLFAFFKWVGNVIKYPRYFVFKVESFEKFKKENYLS